MIREQLDIPRMTLPRGEPLVPCCYAEGKGDRWNRQIRSCGAMIPHWPKHDCPNCGQRMIGARPPLPSERSLIVTGNMIIYDEETNLPAVIHMVCASALATNLAAALAGVNFDPQVYHAATTTARLSGLAVTHRTFGYQPPVPMRRRYGCSTSQFNTENPKAMGCIARYCQISEHLFRVHAPQAYDHTANAAKDAIPGAWRIAGTPWSGGIINQTAALPYHKDRNNLTGSWSAMMVARRHVSGGFLHLADYGVYLTVPHGSITIFDGQSVVHGVTPLIPTGPHAHRYSVVVYSKQGMKKCSCNPADEPGRAAMEATLAEDRRIGVRNVVY